MKLKAKKYTLLNMIPLIVSCAPVALGVCLLMNVVIGVIPIVSALATAWFVDSALSLVTGAKAWADMVLPIASVFLIRLVDFCRWDVDGFVFENLNINLMRHYRPVIIQKAARLKYRYIEDGKTWDLIYRMCEDPNGRLMEILDGGVYLLQLIAELFGVLALIWAQVPWAAVLVGALFVPVIIISMKVGEKNYRERALHSREMRRSNTLRDMATDREFSEERATFAFGDYAAKKYDEDYDNAYKSLFSYWKRRDITTTGIQSIFIIMMVGTAIAMALPAIRGEVSVGMLVAVLTAVLNLSTRIGGLEYCMRAIGSGKAYAKELTEYACLPEQEGALDVPADPPVQLDTLEFRHVTFAYPGTERKILDDFSLLIEKGKHYAFVGVNGAGKTTMTKLICGLYNEFEGEILLNGKDIRSYSQAELKSLCVAVFQDFVRFQVSMRESITLGDRKCEKKLEDVLKATGLEEAAATLEKGLDTPLGKIYEGGQDLSGGQWQRLAIARALVRNAPLRILDEPTAALDPISESEFYESFGELSKGVTTLFISHRLGSTRLADRIFVLDGGRIAEEGTQAELMAKGGLYADMYEAQRSWYE